MNTSTIITKRSDSDEAAGPKSPADTEEGSRALDIDDPNNAEPPMSPRTEWKGEKQSDTFQLQEDIYALLFISPVRSQAFIYSVFWFLFQATVIVLIAYDLLKDAPDDNALKIPAAVHPAVSAAQVFALAIAVISQDDVISTLALVSVGYSTDRVPAAANRVKWVLSNFFRCCIGLASLFISFLFVVQSDGVLDLFQDFAAMVFVSEIDDAAFALAKRGFISDTLEEAARGLEDISFESKEDKIGINADRLNVPIHNIASKAHIPMATSKTVGRIPKPKFKSRLRRVLLFALFGIMVAFWGVSYSRQKKGEFICKTLSANFGDEHWGQLQYSYFSGTYELGMADNGSAESIALRAVYYERGEISDRSSGKFFYCEEERAWVFGIAGLKKSESDEGCNWLLRSPETESFDLSDVPTSGWSIWTGTVENTDSFFLKCNVCNSNADCNYHGTCNSDGTCTCDPGWRGEACHLETFCDVVQLYRKDDPKRDFALLRDNHSEPILAYDRPVYFFQDDSGVDAFVYTGRRWYFIIGWKLSSIVEEISLPFFHAFWRSVHKNDNLEAFSEPTENSMPTGLHWFVVSASRARGDFGPFGFSRLVIDAEVHCKSVDCDIESVCGLYGQCAIDTCVCDGDGSGHFCEYSNGTFADDIS